MDKLDNIFNLSHLEKSNISLSKALLFFYLLIAGNFTGDLFSGQLQDFFKNNRGAKHTIGLITMLVLIISFAGVTNIQKALLYTAIGYTWFNLTTKLNLNWNLAILGLLVLGFLYESNLMDKETSSYDDEALEEADKIRIKKKNNRIKTIVIISIMVITLIGTFEYYYKKKTQYGNNFDVVKFICDGRGCRIVGN